MLDSFYCKIQIFQIKNYEGSLRFVQNGLIIFRIIIFLIMSSFSFRVFIFFKNKNYLNSTILIQVLCLNFKSLLPHFSNLLHLKVQILQGIYTTMKPQYEYDHYSKYHTMNRVYQEEKQKRQFKVDDLDAYSDFDKKYSNEFTKNNPQRQNVPSSYNNGAYTKEKYNRMESSTKESRPFFIKRAVYVMLLLAFMMLICFYFDLLQNYDFLSLILGFVACIIFQVNVLQYIFKREMTKMQIDEYGALRSKIKYWFGELNSNYLDVKNRKKYYHHSLSQEDKLFDKQNEDIYNNTMQYLVSKSQINHIQNIQSVHRKWQTIITKYEVMKKFVMSFMQIHSGRAKIYTGFLEKINNSYAQGDFQFWNEVLKTKNIEKQSENNRNSEGIYNFFGNAKRSVSDVQRQKNQLIRENQFTDFSLSQDGFSMSENNTFLSADLRKQLLEFKKQTPPNQFKQQKDVANALSWKEIINILEYSHRINNKKIIYMNKSVLDELKLSSQRVKIQRQLSIKQLQTLKNKYQENVKAKQEVMNQVKKLKQRIDQVLGIVQTMNRTTENHQEICKMEVEVRIKKVQIQSLEVKQTLHNELLKQISYELYVKCRQTNKELQIRTLPQFNNKLSNYINMLLDYQKRCSKFIFSSMKEYSTKKQPYIKSNLGANIMTDKNKLSFFDQVDKSEQNQQKRFVQLFQSYRLRQKSQNNMKIFFQDTKKFYRQLNTNLQNTVAMIQNYQTQLFQKINSQNLTQANRKNKFTNKNKQNDEDSSHNLTTNYATNLLYDRYFLTVLGSLSRKDHKIFSHCTKILQKQSSVVNDYILNCCKPADFTTQKIYERYKKVDEQRKKLQKNKSKTLNLDQFQIRVNQLHNRTIQMGRELQRELQKKRNFYVPSVINELTNQIVEKHYKIYEYILFHEKKSIHFEAPTEVEQQQQDRSIRFKQYQLYVLKVQTMNFDDPHYESLSRGNQNRAQNKRKPLVPENCSRNLHINPKEKQNYAKTEDNTNKQKHQQSKEQSLKILNRLLGVLFQEWSNSQFFQDLIKQELYMSLNFKRPGLVEPIHIEYLKIQEKSKQSGFQDITPHASQTYRCLFDLKINFKGKIAVHIKTRLNFGNRTPLNINLLIKQFVCPIRICFNPYSIAKSYASLLQRPYLNIEYDAKIGQWHINRIPFFSQIVKLFIVLKLRKKMLWPKRITLSVPLAFKNPIGLAIRERILFQSQKEKRKMN